MFMGRLLIEIAELAQATVVGVPDDDVVEDFDFQELAGADEVAGYLDVGFRRGRFPARVVMGQDNRGGACDNRQTEHLAWMDEQRVDRADRNQMVAFDPAPGVHEQDAEALALGIEIGVRRYVEAPVIGGALWRVAKLELFRRGAFLERDDFVFVGLSGEGERGDEGFFPEQAESARRIIPESACALWALRDVSEEVEKRLVS